MSETFTVTAEARKEVGKGAARRLRRNGMIPAIIYGGKQEPLPIAIPYKETFHQLHAGGFMTTIANVEVDGKTHKVLPKTYDLDPVRDFLVHVDFLRVSERTRVTVQVPVHFEGEDACQGLQDGGVLNVVRHEVEVEAPAGSIPDALTISLEGYEVGATINASALSLPRNVEPTITDRDFTIATIAAPAALVSEEMGDLDEEQAPVEDEVEQTGVQEQHAQTVEGESETPDD